RAGQNRPEEIGHRGRRRRVAFFQEFQKQPRTPALGRKRGTHGDDSRLSGGSAWCLRKLRALPRSLGTSQKTKCELFCNCKKRATNFRLLPQGFCKSE